MTALMASEARRMYSRRLIRTTAVLAILSIVIAAVVVGARSKGGSSSFGHWSFGLTSLRAVFEGASPLLIITSWLLGASFIGADWHAGTVTTVLTWEPRRIRLMLAKLLACVAVVFLFVILLQAILGGTLAVVAALRGSTAGTGWAWIRETAGVAFRVAALSSVGAAIGFAIASVARNTAAALGVGFGYTVVVENLVRGLRPQWERWLMGDNAVVFITGRSGGFPFERSALQAGLLMGAYALTLLLIALAVFRARDVA